MIRIAFTTTACSGIILLTIVQMSLTANGGTTMKTNRSIVIAALLAAGLVGLMATAQADLRIQLGGGPRLGVASAPLGAPWYGYVLERGRGWVQTSVYDQPVRLNVQRGRVPLQRGDRFRIIPIRRDGGKEVAEMRHEGDVLAIVKYTPARTYFGSAPRHYDDRGSPFRPGSDHRPAFRGQLEWGGQAPYPEGWRSWRNDWERPRDR